MALVDEAVITARSGNGGNGCVSFRRERYIPRGGPDGGDGGRGGHVILRASAGLRTLSDFAARRLYQAPHGAPGRGRNQSGRNGSDLILEVPPGTVVLDEESGALLADLVQPGREVILLRGGRGGRGNQHFATPTRRAPRYAQKGGAGQQRRLRLSLKLLADIGLVGLPNAGKSTLLASLTAARPRTAPFPFTTLTPNLGALQRPEGRELILADIPGLIDGASQGRGLGLRFLKHAERTRFLLHLVDISSGDVSAILAAYHSLRRELKAFDRGVEEKPELILLNKIDLRYDWRSLLEAVRKALPGLGDKIVAASALSGEGVHELRDALLRTWENCAAGNGGEE